MTKHLFFIGILVGLFDAIAAVSVNYKIGYKVVFKYVASGIFGKTAFENNYSMVIWGIFFHFLIALIWTFLYAIISLFLSLNDYNYLVPGIIYGIIIMAIMQFVIIPLSLTNQHPFNALKFIIQLAIHIVCIGLPIAFFVKKITN